MIGFGALTKTKLTLNVISALIIRHCYPGIFTVKLLKNNLLIFKYFSIGL